MNDTTTDKTTPLGWRHSLLIYLSPSSLRMLTLGFAAGLPLLLVLGTLSFRLREAGIDRATIGFLSWVGLAYGFKWAWAPLVDRLPIPLLRGLAGSAAKLVVAGAKLRDCGVARHGHEQPTAVVGALGGVCLVDRIRLGHARHCAGCISH